MKEIKQGTFYGYDLVLKVPDDIPDNDKIINGNLLEDYIKTQKKFAIQEYKDNQLLNN